MGKDDSFAHRGLNGSHDFFDFLRQQAEQSPYAGRVAVRTGEMCDADIKMGLEIKVEVRLRDIEEYAHDLIAIVQIPSIEYELWRLSPSLGSNRFLELHAMLIGIDQSWFDDSMFVSVVEVLENGEQGREFRVPAIVRLERLDNAADGFGQKRESASKVLSPATDREITVRLNITRDRVLSFYNDGINKVVESAPKIVQCISDNQAPFRGFGRSGEMVPDNNEGRISITLRNETLSAALSPRFDSLIESIGVFFGPLNLSENTIHVDQTHSRNSDEVEPNAPLHPSLRSVAVDQ